MTTSAPSRAINTHWRSKGGVARDNDAFFTNPDVARHCVEVTAQHLPRAPTIVLEPAAGDGAFVSACEKQFVGARVVGSDIQPAADNIGTKDFYKTNRAFFGLVNDGTQNVLVITNPPFGKNASDAVGFFNHAGTVLRADAISMILPRSFRKPSIIDRLDDNYRMVHEEDIANNSFRFRESASSAFVECDVPTTLQIWLRSATKRAKLVNKKRDAELLEENDYIRFVGQSVARASKDNEKFCDFVVQRVGVAAGRATFDQTYVRAKKASGNFYFISVPSEETLKEIRENEKKFSDFLENTSSKGDSAGMPSISKMEFLTAVTSYFQQSKRKKVNDAE